MLPSRFELISENIRQCSLCPLSEHRTHAVPGQGNINSKIIFIGEGPGKKEDESGVPFCGASGKFLDQLLDSINLSREDVFITNIVKCRPPQNRDPLPSEKQICAQTYLDEQTAIIKPKLIITLGRHSMGYFLPGLKISEVHGQPIKRDNQNYLALYHPAVALYNAGMRGTLFEDFAKIPLILKKI